MNCPRCTVPLLPDARFCGSCGFTIVATEPQVRTQAATASPPPAQQYQAPVGAFHFDTDGRGQGRGYTWAIEHQGAFALAVVNLQPEQGIHAEAGAMVSMSSNVDLFSEMKGGVFGALKRAVGGESAFVSTFTAKGGPGEVTFAPGAPGDVAGIEMQNQTFMVQSSSYLAGDMSLTVDTKFGGAKSFFGGEGLFVLQISGTGLLLVSSFGAIHRKMLRPGNLTSLTPGTSSLGKDICNTTFVRRQKVGFSAVF